MSSRYILAVATLSAASTLFACGSSEPSPSAVPDHPTSCSITATLALGDGGIGYPTTLPSHSFTATIDWAAGAVTSGSNGYDALQVPLAHQGDAWATQDPMSFHPNAGELPSVTYTSMTLRPTDTGCTGEANGKYSYLGGDVGYSQPFNATPTATWRSTLCRCRPGPRAR